MDEERTEAQTPGNQPQQGHPHSGERRGERRDRGRHPGGQRRHFRRDQQQPQKPLPAKSPESPEKISDIDDEETEQERSAASRHHRRGGKPPKKIIEEWANDPYCE